MRTDFDTLSPPHSSDCPHWCGPGGHQPVPHPILLLQCKIFYSYSVGVKGLSFHHISTVPGLLDTKEKHINNGNFLQGVLTQLSSSKQGKFGGKSEGIIPQRDAAKTQPAGNTSSCFPRDIQLFSTANKFPARVTHHSQALFNVPLEHMPLTTHTEGKLICRGIVF